VIDSYSKILVPLILSTLEPNVLLLGDSNLQAGMVGPVGFEPTTYHISVALQGEKKHIS